MIASSIRQKIEVSFREQSLMKTIGAELDHIEAGQVTVTAPILPSVQQQHGYAHAGLTFALGDTAAGYAALSMMDETAEVLTAEMKINLLAPGRGDRLIARGRVIKPGRLLVVTAADVFAVQDGKKTLIAALMGTMVPL